MIQSIRGDLNKWCQDPGPTRGCGTGSGVNPSCSEGEGENYCYIGRRCGGVSRFLFLLPVSGWDIRIGRRKKQEDSLVISNKNYAWEFNSASTCVLVPKCGLGTGKQEEHYIPPSQISVVKGPLRKLFFRKYQLPWECAAVTCQHILLRWKLRVSFIAMHQKAVQIVLPAKDIMLQC